MTPALHLVPVDHARCDETARDLHPTATTGNFDDVEADCEPNIVQCAGCEHYFDAEDIREDGFCGMCAPLTAEENEQARQESAWEIENDR